MIIHSVIFKLKYPKDSIEEQEFLKAALKLKTIPGVRNLKAFYQISKKNKFDYGLTMEFETSQDYGNYNVYPAHTEFIKNFWMEGVEDFLEIDYKPLDAQN